MKSNDKTDNQINEIQRKYKYVMNFINTPEPLSKSVAELMINVCHEPLEKAIYDSIICDLADDSPDSDYITAGATLYYQQRRLNKKLGRTFYNRDVKDSFLLFCIIDEIARRKPEWKRRYSGSKNKNAREQMMQDIFEEFQRIYPLLINNVTANQTLIQGIKHRFGSQATISQSELFDYLNTCVDQPSQSEKDFNHTDFISYFKVCMHTNNLVHSETDLYTQLEAKPRNMLNKAAAISKDRLYWTCIGIGADLSQFYRLRSLLQRESATPELYSDCDVNNRDAKIQSVFMDIHGWIRCARDKKPLSIPKQLLDDVNSMLRDNGFKELGSN